MKINNKYVYSESQLTLIKKHPPDHKIWGCSDLESIRCDIRNHYRQEQKGVCAYCGNLISLTSPLNANVEHIVAKSVQPQFMFESQNMCVICADCNQIKKDQEVRNDIPGVLRNNKAQRYPRSSSAFKIVHPHFDIWSEHIIKMGVIYIDRSTKGAYTILTCKLNRYVHAFGIGDAYISDAELIKQATKVVESANDFDMENETKKLRQLLIFGSH
ncbi:MAG TPA: hypothetical protein DIW64_07775 [Cellvibrio sp.]|nr:hypothetical protein [Cellvibrio sp.]